MVARAKRYVLTSCLLLAVGACGSNAKQMPPVTPPPAAGGTGAFGIITVNGKQKMYLPQMQPNAAGHAVVNVVDVGLAGNGVQGVPALVKAIDLGGSDGVTATGGDSSMVIAASTDNAHVTFIDPSSDTVVGSLVLDAAVYGQSSFSGGGGYVTGIAMDAANGRAFLSVWNGFAIVSLASKTITTVIEVPPSENFGFDSVNQRIIAPFYQCNLSFGPNAEAPASCGNYTDEMGNPMTDGLNIIDLADGNAVYTFQNPAAPDPTSPVGTEPDSAAANPVTGKIIVPSEGDSLQSVIDLSQAVFDKAKKWVTAPQITIPGTDLTGVAIESVANIAFWEEEHLSDIGVADLSKVTATATTFIHALMPDVPPLVAGVGSSWENLGDPHGIAVTTGISNGHPVGFVVSSDYHWVGRVDLTKMLSLPTVASFLSPSGRDIDDVSSAVTYLDATTSP